MATANQLSALDLVEEGTAFEALSERNPAASESERIDVVIIGGGQAGLSVGYHLKKRGVRFVILDGGARSGDTWRKRWDSLRLFTPAWLDSLDGLPFPAPAQYFPTKDEMADYLELYASHFQLPVRSGVRVESLTRKNGRYLVKTSRGAYDVGHVVVAMANYQKPREPAFAKELRTDIVQIHSGEYKNPSAMRPGPVLIAGAGNSGSEIAMELGRLGHRIWMSGRDTGHAPFRIDGFWGKFILTRLLLRVLFHRVMTVRTPMGRKMRAKVLRRGGPLIRVKPGDLASAGVERVPRVAGVRDGMPVLDDGRVLDVANVVWCTGFERGFDFIKLPIFDESGEPRHVEGVAFGEPGLYFVGLHFLYAMSSTMIHGVGRDAARIATIVSHNVAHARSKVV